MCCAVHAEMRPLKLYLWSQLFYNIKRSLLMHSLMQDYDSRHNYFSSSARRSSTSNVTGSFPLMIFVLRKSSRKLINNI